METRGLAMSYLRGCGVCGGPLPLRYPWRGPAIQFRSKSTASSTPNHYETLGVENKATKKEIKAAFFTLSKKYHPDMNKGDTEMTEKFVKMKDAYTLLMNDAKRKEYDLKVEQPFATRQSYSSSAPPYSRAAGGTHRAGTRPIPNQPRRPLRTRAAGASSTGSGQYVGYEADEKADRARRMAEQMERAQNPKKIFYADWQGDDEWAKVANQKAEVAGREFLRSQFTAHQLLMVGILTLILYLVFVLGKRPEDVQHQSDDASQLLPEHNPRSPRAANEAGGHISASLGNRRLTEEQRMYLRQRQQLRLELLEKAAASSTTAAPVSPS